MARKLIDLDAVMGEPAVVKIDGVEYKVADPPFKKFLGLQKELTSAQDDDESIERLCRTLSEITGIPQEAVATLNFAQFRAFIRELQGWFTDVHTPPEGSSPDPLPAKAAKKKKTAKARGQKRRQTGSS